MYPATILLGEERSEALVSTVGASSSRVVEAKFDGAFDSSKNIGGIGVIFRNSLADVVGGQYYSFDHVSSLELVEAMAGRMAYAAALDYCNWFLWYSSLIV